MTELKRSPSRRQEDSVRVVTATFTTHVVDIDISSALRRLNREAGDRVTVTLLTPSGRSKRVDIPSHMIEDDFTEIPTAGQW